MLKLIYVITKKCKTISIYLLAPHVHYNPFSVKRALVVKEAISCYIVSSLVKYKCTTLNHKILLFT